jgi:hypothetical protein
MNPELKLGTSDPLEPSSVSLSGCSSRIVAFGYHTELVMDVVYDFEVERR